jgi:hypothetical protein
MAGRCCALTGVLDAAGQHKRCALTDSGNSFCVRYHETADRRIFGTIWAHADNCRVCSPGAPPPAPPPSAAPYLLPSVALTQRFLRSKPPAEIELRPDPESALPASLAARRGSNARAFAPLTASSAPSSALVKTAPLLARAPATVPVGPPPKSASASPAAATVPRVPPVNAVLYTPVSAEARELEARYTGPSGLLLRVRVARQLQPLNWCVPPPDFTSCLDPQRVSSSARIRELEARLDAEEEEREERRELKRQQSSLLRAESRGVKAGAGPVSTKRASAEAAPIISSSSSRGHSAAPSIVTSPVSDVSEGSDDVTFICSTSSTPGGVMKSSSTSTGVRAPGLAEPLPVRLTAASLPAQGSAATLQAGRTPAASPGVAAAIASGELAAMRSLHRSALAADLESSPMGGDSWLTSTLIDAVAFE